MDLFRFVVLPLHVFCVVTFGGVLFGCFVQSVLLLWRDRMSADFSIPLSFLFLGIPMGSFGVCMGALMATHTGHTLELSWLRNAMFCLTLSLGSGGIGTGFSVLRLTSLRGMTFFFSGQSLWLQSFVFGMGFLLWLFGLFEIVTQGGPVW